MGKASGEPVLIGRYEIRGELGRGMMGVVYRAFDPALNRQVALKTVTAVAASGPQREAWERRFLTEARAAARLSHPGIVVVHDVGRDPDNGTLYMALEYLEGETLAEKIALHEPLPWREAARIVARVASALDAAHRQGIVHRDVKPANIMVLPSGEPKILDFGVARLDAGSLTVPGDLCGTPLYMSPEQAEGGVVDARSDLFSLGAVAWALLVGRSPFEAGSLPSILARVIHREPAPPSRFTPEVPPELDDVVCRALAKAKEARYPNGTALAEDLEDVLEGRPPRHRGEWQPPPQAEQTVASARLRDEEDLTLLKPEVASRPRSPGRRTGLRLTLMLVLLAAAGAWFHGHPGDWQLLSAYSRDSLAPWVEAIVASGAGHGGPSQETPSVASPAVVLPSASPVAEPEPPSPTPAASNGDPAGTPLGDALEGGDAVPTEIGASGTEAPEAPAAEPTPAATPVPESARPDAPPDQEPASTSPQAAPAPTPQAPGATAGPKASARARNAYLSIGLQHRLASGTLEVHVDGARVLRQRLDSRTTRKALLFNVRSGSTQETLELAPGRHELRVRIVSGGQTKTAHAAAVFRAGATRRLELRLARLSAKIELAWK